MLEQPDGYLALPENGNGEGVLVLHAWWGLNETIKQVCDRLAEAGYVAFAPDLYHGKIARTIPEAEELGPALDARFDEVRAEIADAAAYLSDYVGEKGHNLAVMAFSLGVYYALDLAVADPEHIRSVVVFYGSGDADYSQSQAAYLVHAAENDPYEPQEYQLAMQEALRSAGRPATFHTYPGAGHWFFEPDRTEEYDEAAAALAWQRTLEFLRAQSGGSSVQ